MSEKRARRLVYDRSGGRCEICGVRAGTSWHHRKGRGQGGLWTPSNGLHLCGDGARWCHGMVTNTNGRRDLYEGRGWIVRRALDPAAVPVWLASPSLGQVWALLDDDGGITVLSEDEARERLARWGLLAA